MTPSSGDLRLFNLETMAGVFPGARTKRFQRLRLRSLNDAPSELAWFQLLWYEKPAACVLYRYTSGHAEADLAPLMRLAESLTGDFGRRFRAALEALGLQLHSCGSCTFWRPTGVDADGLPLGRCEWMPESATEADVPANLATQSYLALGCSHWQETEAAAGDEIRQRSPQPISRSKGMKVTAERERFWQWLHRLFEGSFRAKREATSRTAKLVERSGVGAGTEPCFACQGRIANLGALAVETADGDKQTFSLWRCRACYTIYLNDWIDRWERLDNLETEESYYRVAPAEALTLFAIMESVVGGEHPGARGARNAQRDQFQRWLSQHSALSHQIKQGR